MSIRGFYLTIDGVKIYCETNDGPGADPIICVHTAGREGRQYHGVMELLQDKHNMVSFDMPGHGKSWPLPGNKVVDTNEDFGKWIWAVCEALGVANPFIIGCSMGGNIVYHMAINYPVKAICSMQGADYTPTVSENILELLDHPYVSCQHSHLEFSECLIGSKTTQERKDFIMWGVLTEIGRVKRGDLTMYSGFDVREQMSEITCPVLIIQGDDDLIATTEMARKTAAKLTNARDVVFKGIEGYGHFIAVENPELVAQYLDEFVRDSLTPAAGDHAGRADA